MENSAAINKWQAENDAHYRKLGSEDAREVHELEKLCFSLPWSQAQCLGALKQPNFGAYGLWRDARLCAYVSFYHTSEEMEIVNLAVHPDMRERGIASQILGILLQAAAKMGIEKVVLEVREGNMAARALYRNAGFRQTGTRRAYYPDTNETALVLTRNINK